MAVAAADLHAAIDALITNVLTHTPEGTDFRVSIVGLSDDLLELTVEDDGQGWPKNFRPRRGRSGRGSTGLGLDIARQAAEGSGGQLRLERTPSAGARVVMVFPVTRSEFGPL